MKVKVCVGSACKAKFSEYIIKRIERDIEKFNLKNIEIEKVNCMGFCDKAPNVKIDNEIYYNTNPIKVSEVIFDKLKK